MSNYEEEIIQNKSQELFEICKKFEKQENQELIQRAYKLAYEAHKDMKRKSGEPYIIHPLEVAKIVASEIGLGAKSVAAALLHDTVEDTEYTIDEIESLFGKKIATIIEGLTKISGVFDKNTSLQAENFRKILLTLAEDVSVIIIKIADRLHNMRTLSSLSLEQQLRYSAETIYLFAPLAHRLGLFLIKTELEDLCLYYSHPRVFHEIETKLRLSEKDRNSYIHAFIKPIEKKLQQNNIKFEVSGRVKSIYSIWSKMQTKGVSFEEIYDMFAIRIIFDPEPDIDEKMQCWQVYAYITDIYTPKPERIRDWVSIPKANGYEALHATVMGSDGNWVEVQIRSRRMDEIDERGFAAHWKYKSNSQTENELEKWLVKIRSLLEDSDPDAMEFLDDFKLSLYTSEIFVFTPKGKLISLPQESTALDFAFEIHTKIASKAIGAKINHKLFPVTEKLKSGDQVEIITSRSAKPQREWLDMLNTAKARTALKNILKAETSNRIEKGKKILEEKLHELNLRPNAGIFRKILPAYSVRSKEELYSKIGSEMIQLDELKKILSKNTPNKLIKYWKLQLSRTTSKLISNFISEIDNKSDEKADKDVMLKIAKCCNPAPGEDVTGFKDESGTIIIHSNKCINAIKLMSSNADSIVNAEWISSFILSSLIRISIRGFDQHDIYNKVINTITNEVNINIRNINLAAHDGIFEGYVDIYIHDAAHLNMLLSKLSKHKGVSEARRIDTTE